MNTKTSLKRVFNYYNGTEDGVGRDSPGALLDMLAEVASQTLHSEKKWTESNGGSLKTQSNKTDSVKIRKSHQESQSFNSSQLLSMPATQLVKQFSVFTSDELKRQYSYTCALVPGCGQRYTSFASEGRARMSIKAHLADHLDYLKRDEEAYSTFSAVAVKHKNSKSGVTNKKPRVCQQKKPGETINKENKETKSTKSTNYLRKILSNEMSFTEFEKQKTLAKSNKNNEPRVVSDVKKDQEDIEFQVLGDHSYSEQVKIDNNEQISKPNLEEIMVNEAMGENIMLMVVESDGVHMKELPYIAQDISVRADQDDTDPIYLPESVTWSEEVYTQSMESSSAPAKPKGKAKFIGTSKEEREMALALMDRIKRKGNPAGGNLQCRICDPPRSFTAPTTLVSHYRSHAGIKPYECRICRAVFTRRHSLKYHMLIHQNQTRFTCADCGKKFRHPSHFREHRRRHTGEAPFGCEDCGQRFKTRNTYKRHLKTRHGKVLTTTGELLHLSEEDFQKVRTNPKRKAETNYSESMIDEDISAPEVIIQLQNQDCSNDAEENHNEEEEDFDSRYEILSKDNANNTVNQLWSNENEETNGDYEYFQESQALKTDDYAKTEITVDNCGFENVEDVDVDNLQYDDNENKDDETVDSECITIGIQDGDNNINNSMQLLETEETNFEETLDPEEGILYDENSSDKTNNLIEYMKGIPVTECEEDVITYHVGEEVVESNYDVEDTQEESSVDYFQNNFSTSNEIEYKEEQQLNIERYEEIRLTESCNDSLQINIEHRSKSDTLTSCEEESVVGSDDQETAIFESNDLQESVNDCMQEEDVDKYLLDETQVVVEGEEILGMAYPNQFLLQEQSKLSNNQMSTRGNVAVERIVEYPTTNYEGAENQELCDNIMPRIYLQTNSSSNNIVIKNKDLMNLLTISQRMKLQQNPDKIVLPKSNGKVVTLLNSQPQSYNILQNGKQGKILLLSSGDNEAKSNYLKIDNKNGVANGIIKTLPVIAVQQK